MRNRRQAHAQQRNRVHLGLDGEEHHRHEQELGQHHQADRTAHVHARDQPRAQRLRDELHHQCNRDDAEEGVLRVAEFLRGPRQRKVALQVRHVDERQRARAQQHQAPVVAHHILERQLDGLLLRQHALHVVGLFQLQADHHAHDHQQRRQQKRHTPAPEHELRCGQRAQRKEHQRRQQVTCG